MVVILQKKFGIVFGDDTKGFKHNWQGLRVVEDLERISSEYKGLNLTKYTLWGGILNHSSLGKSDCNNLDSNICLYNHKPSECNDRKLKYSFYNRYNLQDNEDWTYEAIIVNIADEIAQRHHDVEDGIRAGIIDRYELVEKNY